MKILHFFPPHDTAIGEYVSMIEAQQNTLGAEVATCTSVNEAARLLADFSPSIVHIHGGWSVSIALVARLTMGKGVRYVYSPQGQLQPWIIKEKSPKIKKLHMAIYQRWACMHAACLIGMGKMEVTSLSNLKLNRHIETIRNPLFTESISCKEAARQTIAVYQKVLDTSTLELMDNDTIETMSALIKVGICGDKRWIEVSEQQSVGALNYIQWRQVILHAHYHNISDIIEKGARIIGVTMPEIDITTMPTYNKPAQRPDKAIGTDVSGASKMIWLIQQAQEASDNGMLSFCHLTDIAKTIYNERIDEQRLEQLLADRGMTLYAQRLMALLERYTDINEGFMPIKALYDRTAKHMLKPDTLTKCIRL